MKAKSTVHLRRAVFLAGAFTALLPAAIHRERTTTATMIATPATKG
jgi:hypothetical protein